MEHLQEQQFQNYFRNFEDVLDYFLCDPRRFFKILDKLLTDKLLEPDLTLKWWWYDMVKEGQILITKEFFDLLRRELENKYKVEVSDNELEALFRYLGLLHGRKTWLSKIHPASGKPTIVLSLHHLPEIHLPKD